MPQHIKYRERTYYGWVYLEPVYDFDPVAYSWYDSEWNIKKIASFKTTEEAKDFLREFAGVKDFKEDSRGQSWFLPELKDGCRWKIRWRKNWDTGEVIVYEGTYKQTEEQLRAQEGEDFNKKKNAPPPITRPLPADFFKSKEGAMLERQARRAAAHAGVEYSDFDELPPRY